MVCKILESIIRENIVEHMRSNKLFSDKQFGFISGRSIVLQLILVIDNWTEILDEGGCMDVAYCDFMKAFDKVCHKRLVHKLKLYKYTVFKMDRIVPRQSTTESHSKWCCIKPKGRNLWYSPRIGPRANSFRLIH